MSKRIFLRIEFPDDEVITEGDVKALKAAIKSTDLAKRLIRGKGSAVFEMTLTKASGDGQVSEAMTNLKASVAKMPDDTLLGSIVRSSGYQDFRAAANVNELSIATSAFYTLARQTNETLGFFRNLDPQLYESFRNIGVLKAQFLKDLLGK